MHHACLPSCGKRLQAESSGLTFLENCDSLAGSLAFAGGVPLAGSRLAHPVASVGPGGGRGWLGGCFPGAFPCFLPCFGCTERTLCVCARASMCVFRKKRLIGEGVPLLSAVPAPPPLNGRHRPRLSIVSAVNLTCWNRRRCRAHRLRLQRRRWVASVSASCLHLRQRLSIRLCCQPAMSTLASALVSSSLGVGVGAHSLTHSLTHSLNHSLTN